MRTPGNAFAEAREKVEGTRHFNLPVVSAASATRPLARGCILQRALGSKAKKMRKEYSFARAPFVVLSRVRARLLFAGLTRGRERVYRFADVLLLGRIW